MMTYKMGPMTHDNERGWHQKGVLETAPVTREEYEGLFGAIVRLTDRIEALEHREKCIDLVSGRVTSRPATPATVDNCE